MSHMFLRGTGNSRAGQRKEKKKERKTERTLSSVGVNAGTASGAVVVAVAVAVAIVAGVRGTEMTEVMVAGPATSDAELGLVTVDTAEKLECSDSGAEPSPTVETEEELVTSVTSVTSDKAVGESGMIE